MFSPQSPQPIAQNNEDNRTYTLLCAAKISECSEDHRKAGNKDSDGSEGGNVTDHVGHCTLLTRYVSSLFSFCFRVNMFLHVYFKFRSGAKVPA